LSENLLCLVDAIDVLVTVYGEMVVIKAVTRYLGLYVLL